MRKEKHMKISARNVLSGKIAYIHPGTVNAIVGIDIGGGMIITSTISMDAVQELGLIPDLPASAIIKASSVMVSVE